MRHTSLDHRAAAKSLRRVGVFTAGLLAMPSSGSVAAQAPVQYRVEINNESSQDNSGLRQGVDVTLATPDKTNTVAFLSVTERDSAGGKLVHVLVDSVRVVFDGDARDLGKGREILLLVKGGKRVIIRTPVNAEGLTGVMEALPMVVPSLPSGVVRGASWADTVRTDTSRTEGGETQALKRQDVTVWSLVADSITGKVTTVIDGTFKMTGADSGTMKIVQTGEVVVLLDGAGRSGYAKSTMTYTMDMDMVVVGKVLSKGVVVTEVRRVE